MNQNNQPSFPFQDELDKIAVDSGAVTIGVRVFTGTQDLAQLSKVYKGADAQAILQNCKTKIQLPPAA